MTRHRISVRHSAVSPGDRLPVAVIKQSIRTALELEGMKAPCEVNMLITDDKSIKSLNRDFRGVNCATDVLSFPMHEFDPTGGLQAENIENDPETGLLALGDIVMSARQVIKQAAENNQTIKRETSYLTVHSVLHLLGYDHTDEAEGKKLMRNREKEIMSVIDSK